MTMDTKDITRATVEILRDGSAAQAFALVTQTLNHRDKWLPEAYTLMNTAGLSSERKHGMLSAVFGQTVDTDMVEPLARVTGTIGRYGFSFPQWRHVAQRFNGSTLLERFGMRRLHRTTDTRDAALPEPQRDEFGPGFIAIEDDLYIEYRRAYVVCADANAALVIRNNSYYFGRDRLPAPAFMAIGGVNASILEALAPQDFMEGSGFIPWQDVAAQNPALVEHAGSLLKKLDAFDMRFSTWLLNKGAPALQEFIQTRLESRTASLPYLCAVDGRMPPWFPFYSYQFSSNLIEDIGEGILRWTFSAETIPSPKVVLLTGRSGDWPVHPLEPMLAV
jgi:hypothetical protein